MVVQELPEAVGDMYPSLALARYIDHPTHEHDHAASRH